MLANLYTYHNFWVDIFGDFYIFEASLCGECVCVEPFQKLSVITNSRVDILWGMDVSIHQTRHQKLTAVKGKDTKIKLK